MFSSPNVIGLYRGAINYLAVFSVFNYHDLQIQRHLECERTFRPEQTGAPPSSQRALVRCSHYNYFTGLAKLEAPAAAAAASAAAKWIIALFFSQQSKLVMEGFRSLKEGEQVEFTYKKSSKGLESLRVTGPGGGPCAGSERRPKGKVPLQKRKPKGDR